MYETLEKLELALAELDDMAYNSASANDWRECIRANIRVRRLLTRWHIADINNKQQKRGQW